MHAVIARTDCCTLAELAAHRASVRSALGMEGVVLCPDAPGLLAGGRVCRVGYQEHSHSGIECVRLLNEPWMATFLYRLA